jgi:hypothetical protein
MQVFGTLHHAIVRTGPNGATDEATLQEQPPRRWPAIEEPSMSNESGNRRSGQNEALITDPRAARIVTFARDALSEAADPSKAPAMAAYMKTDMPFYGAGLSYREGANRLVKLGLL